MNSNDTEPTTVNRLLSDARYLEPAAVIVIVALAVGLRLWAIDFGFPEHVRPDEQYFVSITRRFDSHSTLDPDWYYYPSLYMYLNAAVWRGYTLLQFFRGRYEPPDARRSQPPTHGIDRIRARAPDIEFLLGRCVTALFGVATVLLVYAIARRFYGRKAAVAAAAFLAVNGLHTLNSHFYKSDVATTFFTLAALGCMARYVQERRIGWNLGAAVCTGLAASTNYYGGFLVPVLILSQFLALSARWEVFAMPAVALFVFAATSPYCLIKWTAFLTTFHRMVFADRQSLYDTLVKQINFDDCGFATSPLLYSLGFCWRYSMGLVLGVVSAVGLVWLVGKRRGVGALLVVFLYIHFVGVASGKAVFMRYYLSLVPILALGAGVLLSGAAQRMAPERPTRQNLLMLLAIVVCGFGSFEASRRQNHLLAREDTRVEARRWLAENLPRGAAVATPVDWWGDFYPYGKPTLPAESRYVPVAPADVRRKGFRYVLVDDSLLRLYSPPDRPQWTSWLAANARLLFEVSPYGAPVERIDARYDQLDAFYVPVARFRGIVRPGPRLCVYQVSPIE